MVTPDDLPKAPASALASQVVAVEVYQRVHEGQNLVTELQSYGAFLARPSAQVHGEAGRFYNQRQNNLSVADIADLGTAWQYDPSHQRVTLAPASRESIDMPDWTRRVIAAIEKGLGHETPWAAIDHRAADGSLHTHIIIRNEARHGAPPYWYIDYQAANVLTELLGRPGRPDYWRQINHEPALSITHEQVAYVLERAIGDQSLSRQVAGIGLHRDAARPSEGMMLGSGRADELTPDRFILLHSADQRVSYYRVDSSPLPSPGEHVHVNPELVYREKLVQQIADSVTYSWDGHTYTVSQARHELELAHTRKSEPIVFHVIDQEIQAQTKLLDHLLEQGQWHGHILKRSQGVYQFTPQALDNLEFGRNLAQAGDLQVTRTRDVSRTPEKTLEQLREQEKHRLHLGYGLSL